MLCAPLNMGVAGFSALYLSRTLQSWGTLFLRAKASTSAVCLVQDTLACCLQRAVFWREVYKSPKALRLIHQFIYSTPLCHLGSSHGSSLPSCFSGKFFGKQSLSAYLQYLIWRSLLPGSSSFPWIQLFSANVHTHSLVIRAT